MASLNFGKIILSLLDSIDNWFVRVRPNLFHLVHQMQTHALIKFHWFEHELWNLFH